MKKSPHPELTQTINRQAHTLAAQSFSAIRAKLEEKARVMLKGGESLDETLKAIQAITRTEAV